MGLTHRTKGRRDVLDPKRYLRAETFDALAGDVITLPDERSDDALALRERGVTATRGR